MLARPSILTSIIAGLILFSSSRSPAQDSVIVIKAKQEFSYTLKENKKFLSPKSLILPTAFLGYGFLSLEKNGPLHGLNKNISEEVTEHPFKTSIDDYLKYAPIVTVYALDFMGIKSKHNFIDRTIIFIVTSTLADQLVTKLKHSTHQLRPDGSTYNSFPSGHTTKAFIGAEFMNQEYGFRSPWYSVAGYAMAATTGGLRIMNNRHWLSDVIAAAGLGILSTKFCYWVYYKIKPQPKKQKTLY